MHLSLLAPETFPAGAETRRRNTHTRCNVLNLRADFSHIAAEFMPEDDAILAVALVDMQVGAAYTAYLYFDNNTMRLANGIRHSLRSDVFCSVQYSGFHACVLL
jgi:hypothetical protein